MSLSEEKVASLQAELIKLEKESDQPTDNEQVTSTCNALQIQIDKSEESN